MTQTFEEYQRNKREREWRDKVKRQKEAMGNAERVARATDWKKIGNEKVKAGNYHEASDYYREAIIYVEDLVDARRKERNDLLVPLYCNLAQVHLKLDENEQAEEVTGKALLIAEIPRNDIHPSFSAKAHYRRALARRRLQKLEEAREDLLSVLRIQPGSEEAVKELSEVKAALAAQAREARERMGGFLNRTADQQQKRTEQQRLHDEEKLRQAKILRAERRAKAEQRQQMERQQMQDAFKKLSEGKMLYEQREKDMEPVRKKELEKQQTLELEQNLMNIIDESKGIPKTTDFDDFMKKKEARCVEQHDELGQKKKILDKKKKEEQWDSDDVWKGQRDDHRKRLEAERQSGLVDTGPRSIWESKEVNRWCGQRLRDLLLGTSVETHELDPKVAAAVLDAEPERCQGCVLRALVTDVLKLEGDASVLKLNLHKPPLHYFDYFLKLDWEVGVNHPGDTSYRTADELIQVAADIDDGKAPPSVTAHCILAGTLKIKEFCSEEEPSDGAWPLLTKVKKRETQHGSELLESASQLQDALRDKVQQLLGKWAEEYREHWP